MLACHDFGSTQIGNQPIRSEVHVPVAYVQLGRMCHRVLGFAIYSLRFKL